MASTNDTSTTSIIKNDRTGRIRYAAAFKAEVLAAFDRSSLSGMAFAEHHGIKYPTFNSWLVKRRRTEGADTSTALPDAPFILAEIGDPTPSAEALEIDLPGGACARATSPQAIALLAQLIKTLA